jgi:hypothetical protein
MLVVSLPAIASAQVEFVNERVIEAAPFVETPAVAKPMPQQVVIRKWRGQECQYCDLWIQIEKPRLEAAGVQVFVDDSLPLDQPAPQVAVLWDTGEVRRDRYMTFLEIINSRKEGSQAAVTRQPDVQLAPPQNAPVLSQRVEQAVNPVAPAGPGYRPQVNTQAGSSIESRLANLESRMTRSEGKLTTVEGRLTKVEEQVKAIIAYRMPTGEVRESTVEIDYVAGYGEFEVPPGGRVVAINGVPIERTSQAVNGFPVYSSGGYETWVGRPLPVGYQGATSVVVQPCANGQCGY